MPLPPPEEDLELLARACCSVAAGDGKDADEFAAELRPDLPARAERPPIPPSVQVPVLRRDHFTCRYCGTRTVPTPVLRAASDLWPEAIPYNPNWRTDSTHPLFVDRAATFDHLRPHSQGGTDITLDNLVTACWSCNLQKSGFSLERLGWTLKPIDETSTWDGLTATYPALWRKLAPTATAQQEKYHRRWLTILNT